MIEQDVASLALHISDTITRNIGHLDEIGVGLSRQCLDLSALLSGQICEFLQVTLGKDKHEWLSLEEGLDGLEKFDLLIDCVAT